MIKYNPKKWFSLIFQFHRSDTFRILLPSMLSIGLYTALFTYVELELIGWTDGGTTAVHSLLGIVLGLVLVFRTNSAYERWWEGRKLWGALINETRNFAMKIQAFLPDEDAHNRQFFGKYITNYVYAMKGHLRGKVNLSELELMEELSLPELEKAKHVPNMIATALYIKCNQLYRRQQISGDQFIILDKEVKALTDIIGACERIKNTPIPYSYSLFMKKFIFIYTMTMPLGFITSFQYWTIPVVMFVFYVLVSIELIAEEIEEPFGMDSNDLPMEEMSLRIKQNIREILSSSQKSLVTGH